MKRDIIQIESELGKDNRFICEIIVSSMECVFMVSYLESETLRRNRQNSIAQCGIDTVIGMAESRLRWGKF